MSVDQRRCVFNTDTHAIILEPHNNWVEVLLYRKWKPDADSLLQHHYLSELEVTKVASPSWFQVKILRSTWEKKVTKVVMEFKEQIDKEKQLKIKAQQVVDILANLIVK